MPSWWWAMRKSHINNPFSTNIFFLLLVIIGQNRTCTENTTRIYYDDSAQFIEEIAKFIGESLIANYLSNCSVVLTTSRELCKSRPKNGNYIAESVQTTLLHLLNANSTTTIRSISLPYRKVKETNKILRFTQMCSIGVAFLLDSQVNSEFVGFFQKITFTPNELTRKDEDYYVFFTPCEQTAISLLQSDLAFQLRYKVVIYPRTEAFGDRLEKSLTHDRKTVFLIKTICIYCPNGTSRSLTLPLPAVWNDLSFIFPDFTSNLHGHVVRVSAPLQYQATYEMTKFQGKFRHKRGIHALIFNIVAAKINMSYTLQPCSKFGNIVREGASGVLLGNGTWAGCVGDVVQGITDMALSVSPDDKRFLYVHFTSAMEYTYVTFTTTKPKLLYSWKVIFTAFGTTVWAFIIVSICGASISIYLLDHHTKQDSCSTGDGNVNLSNLFETWLYLLGYMVGQDVPLPKTISAKLIYVGWLGFGFLIGAAYSCSLQARIVSPGLDFIPKTFSQLVTSPLGWGAASGFRNGLGEQLFKSSSNPVMRAIYRKMEGEKDEVTCTLKALTQYACFNWEIMQRFHLKTKFADKSGNHPFQIATDTAFFTSLNFITRKRELYRSHLNDFMMRSYDTGLVKQTIAMDWRKFRLDLVKRKGKEDAAIFLPSTKLTEPRPGSLDNVIGNFVVLVCGLLTGITSFILEKVITR